MVVRPDLSPRTIPCKMQENQDRGWNIVARKKAGEGQTALVTGASYGIGLDLAECFAKDGYDLIITARSGDALTREAGRLASQYKIRVTPIALDLGKPGGGAELAKDIASKGLNVDVLVNNAGYGIAG